MLSVCEFEDYRRTPCYLLQYIQMYYERAVALSCCTMQTPHAAATGSSIYALTAIASGRNKFSLGGLTSVYMYFLMELNMAFSRGRGMIKALGSAVSTRTNMLAKCLCKYK